MFLTNYFVQNDENLLQKSCVVKAGNISPKREIQNSKKMNYFLNASTARSNFFLKFIYSPPPLFNFLILLQRWPISHKRI